MLTNTENNHCNLTSLRVYLQELKGATNGITSDSSLLNCANKELTWSLLTEDCRLLE